jgi:ubiquinone/menaquinone biosynthesis C-methylase UbiE
MAIIIDPDRRMLSVIENKVKEKGFTNIELIQDYIENLSIKITVLILLWLP